MSAGEHWELLKRPWAERVLNALCTRAPAAGEGFWRVPGAVDDRKVELVIRILEGWLRDHELDVPAPRQDQATATDIEDVDDPSKTWENTKA